jgi:hypothetical protein
MSDQHASFARQFFRRAIFRYTAVAVIAFTVGSASIVIAANTSNSPIFRLGDATDPSRLAAVDGSGNLRVSQQGTVSATLTTTDYPDAATHSKLDTANTLLGKLSFDGTGNLTVAVSNLPAVQTGVSAITLPTHTGVASGGFTEWQNVDISACRTFSVIATANGAGAERPGDFIISVAPSTGGIIELDVHAKSGSPTTFGGSSIGFPTWPGTNEPAYATAVWIDAKNNDASARDMTAQVLCQH